MVVSTGGAAEGADRGTTDTGRPGTKSAPGSRAGRGGGTRRGVMRGLLASALTAALTPLVTASHPPRDAAEPDTGRAPADTSFDETYRGRRIRGFRAAGIGEWYVTVDGRPLHLMRRADGTWLTMVDHYGSYTTPLEAARAAVDEMGPGRRLRDTGHGAGAHGPGQGQGQGQGPGHGLASGPGLGPGCEGGRHGVRP